VRGPASGKRGKPASGKRERPTEQVSGNRHVETVVMFSHKKPDSVINGKVEFGEDEGKGLLDNIVKRNVLNEQLLLMRIFFEVNNGSNVDVYSVRKHEIYAQYIEVIKQDKGDDIVKVLDAVSFFKSSGRLGNQKGVTANSSHMSYESFLEIVKQATGKTFQMFLI